MSTAFCFFFYIEIGTFKQSCLNLEAFKKISSDYDENQNILVQIVSA